MSRPFPLEDGGDRQLDCPTQWVWRFDQPLPCNAADWGNAAGTGEKSNAAGTGEKSNATGTGEKSNAGDAVALLGGKGAMLNRLTQAGYPVPPGFTITTGACRAFLQSDGGLPDTLWTRIVEGVAYLERQTGRRYAQSADPLLLAVRGGAPVSMPGMLETLLNCGQVAAGPNEPNQGGELTGDPWQQLRQAVETVFGSWRGERAERYRQVHGIHESLGTAVNVQVMIATSRAGVLFSRDPRGERDDVMIIEWVSGLGDQLVSGRRTPERLEVPRQQPGGTKRIASDGSLAPDVLSALVDLGLRLEQQLGTAVDVEWGEQAGRIVVFQVRPLEPAGRRADVERTWRDEIIRLGQRAGERPTLWVRHNLDESLLAPTPLTWDIVRRFMSGSGGFGQLYRDLGYRPSTVVREQGFLELVFGRIYADPGRVAELFYRGLPFCYDLDRLRQEPTLLDQAPTQLAPDAADNRLLWRLPGMVWTLWRAGRRLKTWPKGAAQRFDEQVLPEFLDYVQQEQDRDLSSLDAEALRQLLDARRRRVLDQFAAESLRPGLLGGLALARLQHQLTELLGTDDGPRLARQLLAGLDAGDCDPQWGLFQLATGRFSRDEFLERFGHRGPAEMELATPRWREDTTGLEAIEVALRANPAEYPRRREAAERQYGDARQQLDDLLTACGARSLQPGVLNTLNVARRLLPYREKGRHYLMMGYELLRQAIQELAGRCELEQDIYFLEWAELPRLPAGLAELRQVADRRRETWRALRRVALPDVIATDQLDELLAPPPIDATRPYLQGTALSGGQARGSAVVLETPEAGSIVTPACVLVCPTVDPAFTPWLLSAAGLVVERGGLLSHGAIVARQLGIPAVVCPGAMRSIPAGATVVVDGDQGRICVELTVT